MKKPLNNNEEIRKKIIGLGEDSARKTYYPQLQKQLEELKQKNAALEESNKKYLEANMAMQEAYAKNSAILKCLPDLMFTFSKDGTIVDFYANYTDNLYALPKVFMNKNVCDVLPPEIAKLTLNMISKVLHDKEIVSYRYSLEKEGVVSTFESRMIFINDNKLLAVVRDITETVELIKELKTAKEKASHEIRTAMNGILGFAQLLKEPEVSGDDMHHFVGIIERSGKRMLAIINDLIDISRIEAGQVDISLSEMNLKEQMEFHYSFFAPEAALKGLELKLIKNQIEVFTRTDMDKFNAILINLLKNAIKYTQKGSVEFGYHLIKCQEMGQECIEVFVKDTGIGVPTDKQDFIFNRFNQVDLDYTKAIEGAGLGLSIAKAYAELLGGSISLASEEGKGSCFYLKIPYEECCEIKPIPEQEVCADKNMEKLSHLHILVVEDDEIAREYLANILDDLCKTVSFAENGQIAVDFVREHDDIDLVLMDIKLPKMDGYEATRAIRLFRPELPIIAQTAYALSGDREKTIEAGCTDYIQKPVQKDSLLRKIKKYV